jgi:SIR2-like domain/AAA domain
LARVAKWLIRVPVPTPLDELKAAIAGGKALLVCGAGVSRAVAGDAAKGWKGLIESAIDAAPKKPGEDWSAHCKKSLSRNDPDVWLSAADIAQGKLGGYAHQQYRRWLKKSVGKLEVTEPALLDAIKALNCRLATTNYDGLLLLCAHMGSQPETWRNLDAVAEILTGETHDVWHIHGYWNNPESVIFSNADYVRVGNCELAQFLQHHAAFADTLIFIGCSADGLADQNVGKLLEWFDEAWGGLGRNHFALVKESEVSAPGWPSAVTCVPYGTKHEDLPAFLRSLAPASVSVNSIEYNIFKPLTVGRKKEIASVVSAALDRRPCIITGAPGMGKTTVAVAAAYDPQIVDRFGRRRVFVNLEHRSDPLDLLILLASELGLKTAPTHNSTLAAIRHACRLAPAFAILDNVEGLIEANEAETSRLLGLLRDTPGLSFVVTSSENLPGLPGWERLDHLSPLSLDDARSLFLNIATSIQPADPNLQPLLEALDGHALSLTIVAGRVDGEPSVRPMLERWNVQKGLLLQDRRTSVRASLHLSLTSRHMTPIAKRLLTVLGFLPDGIPAGGLKAFLGGEDLRITDERSDEATDALRRLRLIPPRADRSLKLLNPLRECVAIECPLKNPDLERVVSAGLKLLEKGKYVGTDKWPAASAELLPHIGNFAPILVEAGRHWINKVLQVIEPARRLSEHESRFEQAAFLELASLLHPRGTKESRKVAGAALSAAGGLALGRDDLDSAEKYLEAAREICARTDFGLGEANALFGLGVLARRRDDLEGQGNEEKQREISLRRSAWTSGRLRRLNSSAMWRFAAMISMARRPNWRQRGISMSGSVLAATRRMRFYFSAV